jgi:hypothetical protein
MKTPFYGTGLFFCMVVFGCLAFRNGTAREGPYTFALSATLLVIGGLGSLGMLVLGVTSARAGWYWAMVAGLVLLVVPVWIVNVSFAEAAGLHVAQPQGLLQRPPPSPMEAEMRKLIRHGFEPMPNESTGTEPHVSQSLPTHPQVDTTESSMGAAEKRRSPEYIPPPDQPGQPTELAGGPEGWQFQICDGQRRSAIGFRYTMGSWAGKPAVARFDPIFDRDEPSHDDVVILGREGYAVGGVQVVASDLVNAVRVVFARQQAEGALDTSDIYFSEWVGDPGDKKPTFLGEAGTRVIGVCGRHGAVVNALALIVDRTDLGAAAAPDRSRTTGNAATAKQPAPKQAEPEYKTPANLSGKPTNLVGGPEGWQYEMFDQNRKAVVGFRYKMGGWDGQAAVAQLDPLFNRSEAAQNGNVVMARGGYVVGGVQVVAGDLVNAVRIIFIRQAVGGALDKTDFYLSDWIGDSHDESPKILGDGQTRVIGVCGRHGAVINALGLVLDKR